MKITIFLDMKSDEYIKIYKAQTLGRKNLLTQ